MSKVHVVVAGHICFDAIPSFEGLSGGLEGLLVPGKLVNVGPVVTATGGAVANTGLALHRLGVPVRLVGKVGDDLFGHAILEALRRYDAALAAGMIVAPGEASSYSIVLSPPGVDRIFLHCPGANDTFEAGDVPEAAFAGARLFHFGYPPLMRRLYTDGGGGVAALMQRARRAGLTTSLDLAYPDPASDAGRVDWPAWLAAVLPSVDVFLPSLDEILFMLDRPRFEALQRRGGALAHADGPLLDDLSGRLLDLGAAVVGLKLGDQGLYARTTPDAARLAAMGACAPRATAGWVDRRLLAPCFRAAVRGTTGAGDCTIAGFLAGLLEGLSLEAVVTGAVAVGACNVESPDAVSGVPPWAAVQARVAAGWARRPVALALDGWRWDEGKGLWEGERG